MKSAPADLWKRRLVLPCYKISEAARYARTSAQTVGRWHSAPSAKSPLLSEKEARAELSYMQLIELAVVAAMRAEKVKLNVIREAREYCQQVLGHEFPFATLKFKTNGKELMVDYDKLDPESGVKRFIHVNKGGQFSWKEIIDRRLKEFEFNGEGVAVRWHVRGSNEPIVIDPRVTFGAPSVRGIATWAIRDRWRSGESVDDIADDFSVKNKEVISALKFEGIEPDLDRKNLWAA